MHKCIRCGVNLDDENWSNFNRRGHYYICNECYRKESAKRMAAWRKAGGRLKEKARLAALKREVLEHYSGKPPYCAMCGNKDIRVLTIDHVQGNGASHRRKIGKDKCGVRFYPWLRRNNYPKGFQVLCMNCQWIKRHENKEFGG